MDSDTLHSIGERTLRADAARCRRLLAPVDGRPASPTLSPVQPWFTTAFALSGGSRREGAVR
ncbi:hypothetical protein [Streptomyces virginiae]|uniref:hypothetical protein n=1 Tax=Streptomyces virginiae TaxID=1961 RepID=UPI00370101D3